MNGSSAVELNLPATGKSSCRQRFVANDTAPLSERSARRKKRVLDISLSLIGIPLLAVVSIPIGIAIKLDSPGPIFFRQERTGYKGQKFKCWKFRTMQVNELADTKQATENDSRITDVGHFLRRTSLDELPQFLNVLRGEMSVVGPRPHMLSQTENYRQSISHYMARHDAKPGITGWAQVNGLRGSTRKLWMMKRRYALDIWYINNWHLSLDLQIIWQTLKNVIKGDKNAY